MAANGQYKCIDINSDGEEADSIVDGPIRVIDVLNPVTAIKVEDLEEEDPLLGINDKPTKSKPRKRKTPISSEYVDATFDSQFPVGQGNSIDSSPGECLEFVRATLSHHFKAKEMLKTIQGWIDDDD